MKKMICELCGSSELQIDNDIVVCKTCGAKYSVDEAKKLIKEVDIDGTHSMIDKMEDENIDNSTWNENTPENKEKSNKKKNLIIIGAIVSLIALACIYFLNSSSNCSIEGCTEKKVEGSNYCSVHTCSADECNNPVDGTKYCNIHTCKYGGCNNYVDNVDYCDGHVCNVENCTAVVAENSRYCTSHKCKEEGCGEKECIDGYCEEHALINSELPNSLIEYAQSAGFSAKEICKEFTYGGMFDMPDSYFDGFLKYYYKHTQGYYLVQTEYPYEIYYAKRDDAEADLVWASKK